MVLSIGLRGYWRDVLQQKDVDMRGLVTILFLYLTVMIVLWQNFPWRRRMQYPTEGRP